MDVFQKRQCFAVLCGVLWCFAVFCVRVFSVRFHKTTQNRPHKIYKKRTKRTKYALCNTAQYGAAHLSLTQKMRSQKPFAKHAHVQKVAKHSQNTVYFYKTLAKHHKTQNTRKPPAKHRKTPQNTFAITKQTELALANKQLRSQNTVRIQLYNTNYVYVLLLLLLLLKLRVYNQHPSTQHTLVLKLK